MVRVSDFPESPREQGGADAYCPVLLSKLVLLQRHHSWTDRETVHRARCDMAVKAVLGLGLEQDGPSQPTLCRHRNKMQQRQLEQVYMERLVGLLRTLDLVQKDADSQSLQLASGGPVDLHDVMIAQDRASLTLDLAVQVRNKLVDSYHEVMRMQM